MPGYDDIEKQLSDICDETINQTSLEDFDILFNSTDNSAYYNIQKLCRLYGDEKQYDNLPKADLIKSCFYFSDKMLQNDILTDYSPKPHIKKNNIRRMVLTEIIEGYNADTGQYAPKDILSDSEYNDKKKKKHKGLPPYGIKYRFNFVSIQRYITDTKNSFKTLESKFVHSVIVFYIIICILAFAFAFAQKPQNKDVNACYKKQTEVNEKYKQLKEENDKLMEQKEQSDTERERKESLLTEMNEYKENSDDMKNEVSQLNDSLYELNCDADSLEQEKKKEEELVTEYKNAEITLPPGIYVVGKNILEGKYNITGKDALAVSNSWGKLTINAQLTEENQTFDLAIGDTVKIESNTVFKKAD